MKDCWQEGDLRAYLDGELSPSDMQRVAAHLVECPECEARYDEVAGRAGLVSGLMESLADMEPAKPVLPPQPLAPWRKWAAAGAAIAAGIAMVAMLPKARGPVVPPVVATAPPIEAPLADIPPVAEAGIAPSPARLATTEPRRGAPTRAGLAPRRRQLPRDVFLALDDEPMETGVVVRMTLGEEQIPADVVFGKDGRARAIRLIGTQTIH